jgi:hypothetical protein
MEKIALKKREAFKRDALAKMVDNHDIGVDVVHLRIENPTSVG